MIAVVPNFFCCLVLWNGVDITDSVNIAKVKILDKRGGNYRKIDDKEGCKYVGIIVDAFGVFHFEI